MPYGNSATIRVLFVLGSAGIVMLPIASIPLAQQQLAALPPEATAGGPPLWVTMLLQELQFAILLQIAILIRIGCAHRVGLRSHSIICVDCC